MQSNTGLDALDRKLNHVFDGKVVRKDLLHRIKKGTNVPTFVLEFLLARYCASNEPAEIQAGMEAVLATLHEYYVRPDESNAAQSKVAMKGKHKFIEKKPCPVRREIWTWTTIPMVSLALRKRAGGLAAAERPQGDLLLNAQRRDAYATDAD